MPLNHKRLLIHALTQSGNTLSRSLVLSTRGYGLNEKREREREKKIGGAQGEKAGRKRRGDPDKAD